MPRLSRSVSWLTNRISFVLAILLAVVLVPVKSSARDMNPSTGRFMTMDTYEGSKEEPQSLHKYSYAHADPVNGIDPSGRSVRVVTRPLDIRGIGWLNRRVGVHVFLAFDLGGIEDEDQWNQLVRELNANVPNGIMAGVAPYDSRGGGIWDDAWTFSFHPYSVLTGDGQLNTVSVVTTEGSYVAYGAPEDLDAVSRPGAGGGFFQRIITSNQADQMRLYRAAITSRNINNSAPTTVDPQRYEFPIFNCGSWVNHILTREGFAFPNETINLGVGLGTGLDRTGIPQVLGIGARGIGMGINGIGSLFGVFN